jgi:hypothetical protein
MVAQAQYQNKTACVCRSVMAAGVQLVCIGGNGSGCFGEKGVSEVTKRSSKEANA